MFYPTFVIQNVVYGVQFARLTCYFSLSPPPITALGCQEHEEEKRRKTCFLPDTVIHEASDLPHVSTRYPIHHSPVDGGPPPPFTAAEQLASPKDIT